MKDIEDLKLRIYNAASPLTDGQLRCALMAAIRGVEKLKGRPQNVLVPGYALIEFAEHTLSEIVIACKNGGNENE